MHEQVNVRLKNVGSNPSASKIKTKQYLAKSGLISTGVSCGILQTTKFFWKPQSLKKKHILSFFVFSEDNEYFRGNFSS